MKRPSDGARPSGQSNAKASAVKLKEKPEPAPLTPVQEEEWTTFGDRDEQAVEAPLLAPKSGSRLEPVHHTAPDDPLGIYLKDVGAHDLLEPE